MNTGPSDRTAPDPRLQRALVSLEGLSVGDAFGETFFASADAIVKRFEQRRPAPPPWFWTDDTAMAIGIVEVLAKCGHIDQDELAATFARNHAHDPNRGYGAGARQILRQIEIGMRWQAASKGAFSGAGSLGNGAAMRVAPLGAWHAGNLAEAAREAALSAEITHSHPEGIAGAIAVAVAAAWAADPKRPRGPGAAMLDVAIDLTPGGEVRAGIERARNLGPDMSVPTAVNALGNGLSITSPDTVPFVLWNAARRIDDFEDALWETATGMGDVDTTCAMVGGIVGAAVGRAGIPADWIASREPIAVIC
ncbi:MAG: ADP-ribosylglycohydrolase family protein [Planctomycetes bacterium]|nr:ADP-ribosylglycohydrolase family protein [Planctomycetota bacterium]